MKKILAALFLILPTKAFAIDLTGYYVSVKGSVSQNV